jgi:hypothetical protein
MYLKKTSNYGLFMDGNKGTVSYEVYTDASFACRQKERVSTTGNYIKMAWGVYLMCLGKTVSTDGHEHDNVLDCCVESKSQTGLDRPKCKARLI